MTMNREAMAFRWDGETMCPMRVTLAAVRFVVNQIYWMKESSYSYKREDNTMNDQRIELTGAALTAATVRQPPADCPDLVYMKELLAEALAWIPDGVVQRKTGIRMRIEAALKGTSP